MKDYIAMSDFEINCAVGKLIPDAVCFNDDGEPYTLELDSCPAYSGSDFNEVNFEPCNSWADAGPIIEKNKIDINWSMQCGNVLQPHARNSDPEAIGHVGYIHDNPLRAAMIVFLMMQERK